MSIDKDVFRNALEYHAADAEWKEAGRRNPLDERTKHHGKDPSDCDFVKESFPLGDIGDEFLQRLQLGDLRIWFRQHMTQSTPVTSKQILGFQFGESEYSGSLLFETYLDRDGWDSVGAEYLDFNDFVEERGWRDMVLNEAGIHFVQSLQESRDAFLGIPGLQPKDNDRLGRTLTQIQSALQSTLQLDRIVQVRDEILKIPGLDYDTLGRQIDGKLVDLANELEGLNRFRVGPGSHSST